jgi:hypothetical protein
MMTLFAALLGSRPFCYAVAGLAILTFYEGWKYHERSLGGAAVIEQVNTSAEKLADKAVAARAPADKPGAAARMKRDFCRDCRP